MKVQGIALNSANVRYNNANDEARVYDIESNVSIQGQSVNGVDGGVVKKDETVVASFNAWGTNVSPSFQGLEATEMCAVLMDINDYIASVKESVATKVIEF